MKLEIIQGSISRKALLVIRPDGEDVAVLLIKQGLDKNEVAKIKNWAIEKTKKAPTIPIME